MNKNIGYIILEDYTCDQNSTRLIENKSSKKPIGEAIFQSANVRNRNGRWYAFEELDREIKCPRTVELIRTRTLMSECGHPLDSSLQRQSTIDATKANAVILTLGMEGIDVKGTFTPSNTELGKAFEQDLREGMIPAWSLRALGSIKQTRNGAEVQNLRFITYDQVIYPSHPNAYMTRLVSESTNMTSLTENSNILIPIENNSVADFIKESSQNLKFARECFDFMYQGIEVNEAGTKVILKGLDGNTMVINIESYIHNELMNYAAEYREKFNI